MPGSLRAVDSFRYLWPNEKKYTFTPRHLPWGSSCDRVDLILLSGSLVETKDVLQGADILMTSVERGPSDHVPLWVSLNLPSMHVPSRNEVAESKR